MSPSMEVGAIVIVTPASVFLAGREDRCTHIREKSSEMRKLSSNTRVALPCEGHCFGMSPGVSRLALCLSRHS